MYMLEDYFLCNKAVFDHDYIPCWVYCISSGAAGGQPHPAADEVHAGAACGRRRPPRPLSPAHGKPACRLQETTQGALCGEYTR